MILHQVDLSSLESVRKFCATIIETESKIDILVHNAGYGGVLAKAVSVDGIEVTMATNYYGPFLMTNLLTPLLMKSAPCRIVIVSSKAHTLSFLNPSNDEHLNPKNFWPPFLLYPNSKLASLWFTFELARRLNGTGVTVNALHPGTVDTEIWRNYRFPLKFIPLIFRRFLLTVEEGVQTILHVALAKELEGRSGEYFRNCNKATTHQKACNVERQTILWEKSENIVKLYGKMKISV